MKFICFHILLHFLAMASSLAQRPNIGNLYIENFDRDEYEAGAQNHHVERGEKGQVYFGNNEGVLIYNGNDWNMLPLPNNTVVRSLRNLNDTVLFAGGQDAFGYFDMTREGTPRFQSLKPLIPEEHRSFSDVWDIIELNNRIIFCSENKLYTLQDDSILVYEHTRNIQHLYKAGGQLFMTDRKNIYTTRDGSNINPIHSWSKDVSVNQILETPDGMLYAFTLDNGIYSFNSEGNFEKVQWSGLRYMRDKLINDAVVLTDGSFAIATGLDGLFITYPDGALKHHITRDNGLQNNSILSISRNYRGNLWLGLSDGISFVEFNSPFTHFFPDNELEGAVYDLKIKNDKLYAGTNNGLYLAPWKSRYSKNEGHIFKLIPGTEGQVWRISEIHDDLILNHNDGVYLLRDNQLSVISEETGSWIWLALDDNLAIEGNYNGLAVYEKSAGTWEKSHQIEGFNETSRIIVMDKYGHIWVSHPYRGVYRITLSDDYKADEIKKYGENDGLPGALGNYVYDIYGIPYVTTKKGIYYYDEAQDAFAPAQLFNELLGVSGISYLKVTQDERIWYAGNGNTGYLDIVNKGLSKDVEKIVIAGPGEDLVGGFENIYSWNPDNTFICTQNGVIHYYHGEAEIMEPPRIYVSAISSNIRDTSFFHHYFVPHPDSLNLTLKYGQTDFQIEVAGGNDHRYSSIEFAYFLENFDEQWSSWTDSRNRSYTNLPPGEYELRVRARNHTGPIAYSAPFIISVRRPWYMSKVAYAAYVVFGLTIITGIILFMNNRTRKVREDLEAQKQKTEEELYNLQNEKLAADIEFKNRELASVTMHLVQKNETISKLKEEIDKIAKNVKDQKAKKEIKKALAIFRNDTQLESDWENFSRSFDQVHSDFLKRLRHKYPHLSAKDQKLCAYLRMNLTTKEIAPLLNISVRGVEIGRYRLRKKLELESSVNLNEFMMSF